MKSHLNKKVDNPVYKIKNGTKTNKDQVNQNIQSQDITQKKLLCTINKL